MSEDDPEKDAAKKPSAVGTILGVVIATLLAVVCGGGGGLYMAQIFDKDPASATDKAKPGESATVANDNSSEKGDKSKGNKDEAGKDDTANQDEAPSVSDGTPQRSSLAPITTNLSTPAGAWIRLEASILSTKDLPSNHTELTAQIQEDLLGFLRTLKLSQIQGPSGFQHMREDLNDRVKIRSQGAFDKLLIHALLVE